jgi:hypothetical protein
MERFFGELGTVSWQYSPNRILAVANNPRNCKRENPGDLEGLAITFSSNRKRLAVATSLLSPGVSSAAQEFRGRVRVFQLQGKLVSAD